MNIKWESKYKVLSMDTKHVIKGEKGSVRHITQQVELFNNDDTI